MYNSLIDYAIYTFGALMSGVGDSNSFSQLGRLEHNPYANPALILLILSLYSVVNF